MYSFAARRWSPDGARPHVLALPDMRVQALASIYLQQIRSWWQDTGESRRMESVLAPIPADRLHLTLGWADRLTAQLPTEAIGELAGRLAEQTRQLGPVTVRVGPAIAAAVAVELHVAPSRELDRLAAAARRALRQIAGTDAVAEPAAGRPWRPHIAIAYAQDSVDTDEVARALRYTVDQDGELPGPVDWRLDAITVVDQDAWPDDGQLLAWTPGSMRPVQLAGERP